MTKRQMFDELVDTWTTIEILTCSEPIASSKGRLNQKAKEELRRLRQWKSEDAELKGTSES